MSVGDVAALIGAISAAVSALAAIGALWVSIRRGSDRENRRTAQVAVEVAKDPTVTPIERGERGDPA